MDIDLHEIIKKTVEECLPPLVDDPIDPDNYIVVRDGYQRRDIRPTKRSHTFEDLQSLVHYAQRDLHPTKAVLFCSSHQFVLSFDDSEGREFGYYAFDLTRQAKEWLGVGKAIQSAECISMPHTTFREFIEEHMVDLVDSGLIGQVAHMKLKTELVYDADLDDRQNFGFIFQAKEGKGQAKIPRFIEVEIPIFRGSDQKYRLRLRLDFKEPRHEEEGAKGVIFGWTCRNWDEIRDQAIEDLVTSARTMLGEKWLVVRGTPMPRG